MITLAITGYVSTELEEIEVDGIKEFATIIVADKGKLQLPIYFDFLISQKAKRLGLIKGSLVNFTLELKSEEVLTTKGIRKIRILYSVLDFDIIEQGNMKLPNNEYLSKLLLLEDLGTLKARIKKAKRR